MKTKYHYFYKITNKINNHFYYGVHNTSNLNDGYMGSGSRLWYAYKKYGIENFTKEILKFFDSSDEAFKYEAEIVNEELIKNDDCYNIQPGGRDGWNGLTNNNVVVKYKNTKDANFFIISKDDYDPNIYETTWSGKHHTKEQRNTVREKMTPNNSSNPRIWISKNGITKYLRKELLNEYLNNGWELGRINYKPRKNGQGKLLEK
jgi:hypothetical protein